MRWKAGPNAADQLAALANPMSAAEGVVPEIFGHVLDADDLGSATGDIFMNMHPLSTLWDHIGSALEDYTRPRLIQNMLAKMDNQPMGKVRDVTDAGLAALLKLMKRTQSLGDSPEAVSAMRRQGPALVQGLKDKEK